MKVKVTAAAAVAGLASLASLAQAAPLSRYEDVVAGDVVIIGSSIGHDCGAGVAPPAGATATCPALSEPDTAADCYWRDSAAGAGAASAARTSANLDLPAGATVVRAQLYWAGLVAGGAGDATATVDRDGTTTVNLSNAEVQPITFASGLGMATAYQATADVTTLVGSMGPGVYRVTDIEARALQHLSAEDELFGGWVLVVIYQQAGAPLRRIALHDGLTAVAPGSDVTTTVGGLSLAGGTPAGTLGVWGFEGDASESGDRITIDGVLVQGSAVNPATNFFNGSRTSLGSASAGAVPALSGAASTLAGVDIDVVDISAHLSPSTTEVDISAATTGDRFWLGGLVTSIALPPPPDAGPLDALAPDAASVDALAPDTGTAGEPDAAAVDAAAPQDGPLDGASAPDVMIPQGNADGASDVPIGNSLRTVLGGSGCACRLEPDRGGDVGGLAAGLALLLAAALRPRRRKARGGSDPGRARTP
jgi:hypothetical protein